MQELLDKVGWTQTEFAKRIGTSAVTVNIWCKQNRDSLGYRLAKLYLELIAERIGQ